MSVMLITIVVSALRTVLNGLEKRLKKLEIWRIETIQIIALLRLARLLRGDLET